MIDTGKIIGFITAFLLIAPVITKLLVPLISKASRYG